MSDRHSWCWTAAAISLFLVGLLGQPLPAAAQTVVGQARAVEARLLGQLGSGTSIIADTGTLNGPTDAREASQTMGGVFSLLTGDVPRATTIGYPDQVDSEASLKKLAMTVGGTVIGADVVMAQAMAVPGAVAGTVNVDNLVINGVPITVTGAPNQTISIPGGQVVINEQSFSSTETVVNALHVVVRGVADVVIASARAGIQ